MKPDETEDRIRRALQELTVAIDTTPPGHTWQHRHDHRHTLSRRRFVAAGTLVGVAATVGVVLIGATDGDDHSAVTTDDDASPPSTSSATPSSEASATVESSVSPTAAVEPSWADTIGPGEVRTLPSAPIEGRIGPASVWTGAEMLIWGGSAFTAATGEVPIDDGAAFSPLTGAWRTLADAPVQGRTYPAVVWTGSEMIVWGGSQNGALVGDGAAYNPATNTWRTLPTAPIPPAMKSAVAWTGTDMLVVGGLNGDGSAAAYTPSTDTWRQLADAPNNVTPPYPSAVWTGDVVLVPIVPVEGNLQAQLASYQPATDTWAALGALPSQFLVGTGESGQQDRTSLVLSFESGVEGVRLDRTGAVTGALSGRPDDAPRTAAWLPIWTGDEVLIWGGGAIGNVYNPSTDSWATFPAGDLNPRSDGAAVWADGVLITWGGFSRQPDGTAEAASDGIIYRPSPTP